MSTLGRVEDRLVAVEVAIGRLTEKVDLLLLRSDEVRVAEPLIPCAGDVTKADPRLWPVVYTDGCGVGGGDGNSG